ncbi:MAG: tRNA lysidine(34) synthetase TilS [Rhodobacteraceae bacterium]|nr:tRNA lysidine(34) synthetase TilS [Paracoccaceae bacterium]
MSAARRDIVGAIAAGLRPWPERLGVAVSGGGDSLALMHALARLRAQGGPALWIATVDHRLRPEAAAEAARVAAAAADLGLPHDTLQWDDAAPGGSGNLQAAARAARYRLLTGWAGARDLAHVALGHTADDQAETLLMRLARAPGVDGLSGMAPRRRAGGICLLRPALTLARADLRAFLADQGIVWSEDPSNSDMTYDRIKARALLAAGRRLGLSVRGLADVAANMARARDALDHYTAMAARDLADVRAGAVVLARDGFGALPPETARRLLSGAVVWVTAADYPPRRAPLAAALAAAGAGGSATLAGARVLVRGGYIWIAREFNAVRAVATAPGAAWDRRWRIAAAPGAATGPRPVLRVAALGPGGLAQCPDWRALGVPRAVLMATPALWQGQRLCAAPAVQPAPGVAVTAPGDTEDFVAALLSH